MSNFQTLHFSIFYKKCKALRKEKRENCWKSKIKGRLNWNFNINHLRRPNFAKTGLCPPPNKTSNFGKALSPSNGSNEKEQSFALMTHLIRGSSTSECCESVEIRSQRWKKKNRIRPLHAFLHGDMAMCLDGDMDMVIHIFHLRGQLSQLDRCWLSTRLA